jgi:hypothetical protein
VRDSHSVYVHDGEIPADKDLFSLQSRFLVRMARGGEREQVLAVNYSPDPLPFLRPSTNSTVLTGRPVGARKHRQTLPTLGAKWATYTVDGDALTGTTGPYFANVKIKSGMVPVNLIHAIEGVGFDYGMSAREVADKVVAGHVVVQERDLDLSRGGVPAVSSPVIRREAGHGAATAHGHEEGRLSDQPLPLQLEGFPNRPKPLLELGAPFLGTGRIARGFTLPGGAVWTPSFLLFGQLRSGMSVLESEGARDTQWANRFDLFGNLYLTGTERVVFGVRPTDQTDSLGGRQFSGYRHQSIDGGGGGGAFVDELNFNWDTVTHLFFEGELGELFPNMDLQDRKGLDLGISVGRQPINFQEGLLINDFVDAVGITQNNLRPGGVVNLRFTGLYGWNQINRNTPSDVFVARNMEGDRAHLLGGFTEIDWRSTTAAFDVVYVRGGEFNARGGLPVVPAGTAAGDGLYAGVSVVGRPGSGAFNVGLRALTSIPVGDTPSSGVLAAEEGLVFGNPASRGSIVFSEVSWTPHHTENFFYGNTFYALDNYRAAALDPTIPGPLARAGILFAGPGLGNVGGALSSTASDVVGGAFGHQLFFSDTRQQLLLEGGGRYSTRACAGDSLTSEAHAFAGMARYQFAVGRRGVILFDAFAAQDHLRGPLLDSFGDDRRFRVGARAELIVKF